MFGKLLERTIRDPYWNMWGAGTDVTPYGDVTLNGRGLSGERAMGLLTVYACVKFISDSIAMLPLELFRETGKLRTLIQPHPRWLDMPNAEQPRQEFVGQALTSLLLDGNFYALIVRDKYGQVAELWPLHPQDVVPRRATIGQPVVFDVHQQGVTIQTVTAYDMLHVKGMSLPSDIKGRNPIQDARESIGIGLSLQDFAKAFFDNGASVTGVVEMPPNVPADAAAIREQWNKLHQGAKKANGLAVLTNGGTFKPISINPDDAQFLESRNFTGAEIAAGLFGLHPEMIGLTHGIAGGKDITYQNLESRWIELVRRALQPWMTRLEFAFSNLLPGFAMNGQKVRFNVDEYLRADITARYNAYGVGIDKKFLLVNEAREQEDLPPLPGGDVVAPEPTPALPVPVAQEPARREPRQYAPPMNFYLDLPDVQLHAPDLHPRINVNVNPTPIAIQPAEVNVNVEATENHIEVNPTPVEVHPTPVNVTPQIDVHVPPAPPQKRMRRQLVRDAQGVAQGVVEIEEDA